MTFQKGTSGNPAGRPPGIVDRRSKVATAFEGVGEQIAHVIVAKAMEGDMQAAALVLQRISPPLKRRGERVQFALDATQPLAVQSSAVLQAMADGALSPDEAQIVTAALASHAALVQYDTFEARLQALEAARNKGPRSGVVHFDFDPENNPEHGAPCYPCED